MLLLFVVPVLVLNLGSTLTLVKRLLRFDGPAVLDTRIWPDGVVGRGSWKACTAGRGSEARAWVHQANGAPYQSHSPAPFGLDEQACDSQQGPVLRRREPFRRWAHEAARLACRP